MLTQDDIIYFALTDRFRSGNPNNSHRIDRTKSGAFHGGDFAGLLEKIPYFQKLGVTAVWITPVYLNITDFFDSAGYHGYWAIDFERVDPHLYTDVPGRATGSREYLKDLVDEFHRNGFKVILDMVVNHTGYHTPEYDAWSGKKLKGEHFHPIREGFGIEEWLSGLPDLNHHIPFVADYFIHNILDWIEETGIDAIRMDTVKHVEDLFWYLFKSQVKARHPHVSLIGEVLEWEPARIGRYQQEHDFDSVFDFPLRGAILETLVWDAPMTRLARPRLSDSEPKGALDQNKSYTNENRLVTLLDNHDLERRIMTDVLDRVGHWDRDLALTILKLCLSFLFTTRGIPQVYYGTEIGMEGRKDPDNRRDMPWELFGADHLPLAQHTEEREVFEHTARMIRLRRDNPALRYGYLFTLYADQFIYAYLREFRGNVVLVAINNGREPMPVPLPVEIAANSNIPPRIKDLLADGRVLGSQVPGVEDVAMSGGRAAVQLPRKTAGMYVLKTGH